MKVKKVKSRIVFVEYVTTKGEARRVTRQMQWDAAHGYFVWWKKLRLAALADQQTITIV